MADSKLRGSSLSTGMGGYAFLKNSEEKMMTPLLSQGKNDDPPYWPQKKMMTPPMIRAGPKISAIFTIRISNLLIKFLFETY